MLYFYLYRFIAAPSVHKGESEVAKIIGQPVKDAHCAGRGVVMHDANDKVF
jgi:hypothetical protein